MRTTAYSLLLILLFAPSLPAAELLSFRGKFAPVKVEEGAAADKSFTLQVLVADGQTAWTLNESGRGAWPWTERFGLSSQSPSLLYDRGDGFSVVPLPAFFVKDQSLAANAEWKEGGLTYRVTGEESVQKVDAWEVVASNNYGPKRTLSVAKDDGSVVKLDDRVFVGQGTECKLQWQLIERQPLEAKAAQEMLRGFEQLTALRDKLSLPPQTREVKWKAEQLEQLQNQLPALVEQTKDGPLLAILQAAQKDAATQDSRSDALAVMKSKALGTAVKKFVLSGSGDEKLSAEALQGNVTVLHFWDYLDTPLEEPYGQVGYLDFLARQNKNVKVYGVMVDDRLAERSARGQAVASARKVKAFMNLSYPVLLDDGELLQQLGDPRTTGAKLPLWVVIGKDGKVAHYHVGFYDVQRDQGLAELDRVIRGTK